MTLGIARAYAQLGLSVIAIEADLRRPAFGRYADVTASAGVTGVLGGGSIEHELIWLDATTLRPVRDGSDGGAIGLLPAGEIPDNPQRALSDPGDDARRRGRPQLADVVLIDTAPIGTVNDATMLGRMVEGVVIVARLSQTTKDSARRASRSLANLGTERLGIVVTDSGGRRAPCVLRPAAEQRRRAPGGARTSAPAAGRPGLARPRPAGRRHRAARRSSRPRPSSASASPPADSSRAPSRWRNALALALVVRLTAGRRVWGELGPAFAAGAAALALLAGWTLLSATWSDAPARALVEYDRTLLYLLGFLVLGSLGYAPDRLRWALRCLAAGAFVVCLCGLITRVAPDVWPIDTAVAADRLSYPLGYWNALGLLASIGIVLSFALTSDEREPPLVRILAAAALPVLGATLLLTFSRGAIAAGAAGLLVLVLAARPRAMLSGAIVAIPSVAIAVVAAYGADLLAADDPTTAAATAQGHDVAIVIALCAVLAAAVRAALLPLDRWTAARTAPAALRRPAVVAALAGACVVAVVGAAVALGAPDRCSASTTASSRATVAASRAARRVSGSRIPATTAASASGGWRWTPIRPSGCTVRARGPTPWSGSSDRTATYQVEDAHSLYVEVLGELGVVGLVLVVVAIILMLGGFLRRARGPDRVVGGALFAAGVAWALHAGVDWDWEMPAVTFWVFAIGGMALAAEAGQAPARAVSAVGRIVLALGCLALALVPGAVFLSEGPLRESARAFARGDCRTAVDRALDSTSALGVRPEPFILLGYCDVRLGQSELALRALRNAVRKDPRNWEGHYGLALVSAAAGRDPRPALGAAARLNPREQLVPETRRLLGDDPRQWKRRALRARLPID